jgi:hypothetical protein
MNTGFLQPNTGDFIDIEGSILSQLFSLHHGQENFFANIASLGKKLPDVSLKIIIIKKIFTITVTFSKNGSL